MEPDARFDPGKVLQLANCLSLQTAKNAKRDNKRKVRRTRLRKREELQQKLRNNEDSRRMRRGKLKKLALLRKNGRREYSKNDLRSRNPNEKRPNDNL
jgi:hypothetical protein